MTKEATKNNIKLNSKIAAVTTIALFAVTISVSIISLIIYSFN